ncbi:glycerol-3-phosphate dehydrogenase/oxidase [Paenibacillus psychroresistens]|uniref:Glycerol-3-phosphate dehydrogenase n=1 Tax=Paenibacillus psychroresistens TaxID=1778678 RepID=A0A6B8RU84_9BACL|nr:glycerol-3-phosphate dehydrogenase/oxidase [Paenibacillus psychroresistens]QGQ99013.1 glycerol-3-phosphate dehydrogenase/oxidase [Paenibacillus psychroresistens]
MDKSTEFSGKRRNEILASMEQETFDLLIIGGGITGAGIALDASVRGMKTALVDMQDFAAGTSSRSTKLVHGGLRYLKQLEFKIVAEVGKERAIVYENAPHVTTPEWMLLPIIKGGTFGKLATSLGLKVYDFLAGVRKGEKRRMLNREMTLQLEPLLRKEGLKGGGYYVEYRTDDARLTIEVLKEAVKRGAIAVNYCRVEQLIVENGKVAGVQVKEQFTGAVKQIRAHCVINAAGPWVDTIREVDGSKQGKHVQLTKGVHLVFDQRRFPLKQATYFDTADKRMVFAIPRDGKTYIGTTDTTYTGDIVHPQMTVEDRDYILAAANFMFPTLELTAQDIESSWAGLRPLIHEEGKSPSELSRKDEIFISASGLISIAGGKLTGYRKMAERVVDLAAEAIATAVRRFPRSSTSQIKLSGGEVGGSQNYEQFISRTIAKGIQAGYSGSEAEQLVRRYGSNAELVFAMLDNHKGLPQNTELSKARLASLYYAIEHEMVVTPADYFVRRTGELYFDIRAVHEDKDAVISFMEAYFGWEHAETEEHRAQLELLLKDAVTPIDSQ